MALDPRNHQPPLPLPGGFSRQQILDMLVSVSIDDALPGELRSYAETDCDRFLYTLALVPAQRQRVLEIGANPYFTTILMRKFRDLDLVLTNYFGGETARRSQLVTYVNPDGSKTSEPFDYLNANVENETLPYEDGSFDLIVFCEVIEHLTGDPVRALLEIKRLLKPGGTLILTTPNVARLENIAKLLSGTNIYDPYSGHGPYGRHNREYNRHELYKLLTHCGFEAEILYSADVHHNAANGFFDVSRFSPLIEFRAFDVGQYLFTRWRNNKPAQPLLPGWLYRSYDPALLDPTPL